MEKPIESPITSESLEGIKNELDLKKAELALKEKELAAKLEGEKRNIWFTSPLIVGALSAIFGLLGTGIGAALQGYWNTQLERQKFESVLIQKALEQKDREEVAKSLLFLVKAGLIQSLNAEKIEKLVKEEPDQIPLYGTGLPSETVNALSKQYVLGLSLSKFDKNADLSALKERGLQFAYIKVSQGSNRKDEAAQGSVDAAFAAGLKVGLYHFFDPQADLEKQAENFLSELKLKRWNLPPTIDCEEFPGSVIPSDYSDRLYKFASDIRQKTGVKPVIYVNRTFADQYLDQKFSDFPLWIAKYLSGSKTDKPELPRWWKEFSFWHFTGSVDDPALEGLNIVAYNGDNSKLDHLLEQMKVSP
jgi:lysozyme